ncbi:MAG: hypothetical protein Q8L55_08825, partial [Phycisphaerales bacterium]|nr:hypothetical protein [Phycisphaerales bacterium]
GGGGVVGVVVEAGWASTSATSSVSMGVPFALKQNDIGGPRLPPGNKQAAQALVSRRGLE